MKHKSRKFIKRYKKRRSTKRRSTKRRSTKRTKRLTSKIMRKYKGGSFTTSVPINPFPSLPPANTPSSVHQQVSGASLQQNLQNRILQGGYNKRTYKSITHKRNKKYKKQHGGLGDVGVCGGSVVNSSNGYGYVAPGGCMSVPVVPNGQDLAISSAHISAWGQANAQYDPLY